MLRKEYCTKTMLHLPIFLFSAVKGMWGKPICKAAIKKFDIILDTYEIYKHALNILLLLSNI